MECGSGFSGLVPQQETAEATFMLSPRAKTTHSRVRRIDSDACLGDALLLKPCACSGFQLPADTTRKMFRQIIADLVRLSQNAAISACEKACFQLL